jgi:acetyl-CoA acetyltransferase
MTRRVCVVGVAESEFGTVPDKTAFQLHTDAAVAALEDAGLDRSEIDGLFSCGGGQMFPLELGEYMGLQPSYIDSTQVGGSTWELFVQHALAAIECGQIEVALLAYGSTARSDVKRGARMGDLPPMGRGPAQFENVHGPTLISKYAMAARRHMHEFGTTGEQMAQVAVDTRYNASLNPLATFREPISIDDVLQSRWIAEPLHKLDCCIRTDGGGALILTTEERARSLRRRPVRVLGVGGAQSHLSMSQWADFTDLAARRSAQTALSQAGVSVQDIDVFEIYDSFTITVLLTLEALGLCGRGEGGPFVMDGKLRVDGALPTNTDGGGLSCNQPGMRGLFLLIEATRQLRGEAGARQVAGDPTLALCNGTGGYLSSCGTVILGVD